MCGDIQVSPQKTDFLTEQVYQGLDELQKKLQETA